ncbi:DUF943 family protein [Serratia sp. UGAL515B_01]|uniref:DUF943 family protein n=1 Tax=Serratia sp. UGAL515B_01 TaxID=2986763 RepID=UPI002954B17B|nr:DUF943 family protein [Serratia sp. UGAL515B_01]WON75840.1 DUF943 family protein [Serratia sp. UGAL515B_01]
MKGKIYISALLIGSVLLATWLWLLRRPVDIVDVHQRNKYSDVLVRSFPFTNKGKIDWWLENKSILKDKYNIPNPDKEGFFSVTFWDYGDGYKEDKYDRLCFDDMKTDKNCIDKNSIFSVRSTRDNGLIFILDDGKYLLQEDSKLIKIQSYEN